MSDSANTTRYLYPRLLAYAFGFKRYFYISFIGFLLFAATQSMLIYCIDLFINQLEGKPTKWIEFLPSVLTESIYLLPILVVVLSVIRGFGYYFGNYYISRVGLGVINRLRKDVFGHMLYLPQSFYDKSSSGEQISLVIYNIEQVTASVTRAVKILFEDGLFLMGLLCGLIYMNWKLTLIFFAAVPVLSGLVFFAARYFRKVSRKIQQSVGRVSHITNEAVQGIQTVKSYTAETIEIKRFDAAADDNLKYSKKFERVNAIQTPLMHTVIAVALAVIFLLVLLFWPEGQAGLAVVFVSMAGATGKPIKQLSTINSIVQRGLAAAESIFGVLDQDIESSTSKHHIQKTRGDVHFKGVNFAYEKDSPVIKNLNLSIRGGETVALVGQSGSGKSTISNLLMRFYQPNSGYICIDDTKIDTLELSNLRAQVSYVSQDAVIFDASVKENVCYGSGKVDVERLDAALKNANAYDFVSALEYGVDTAVGEGGGKLSGGQRQRLAIARALYKDAPILVLDEATSALDNESERLIQDALEKLKQGRTTIIIAHRLSTVKDADNIVVLEKGEIIEQGSHASLIKKNGAYANLYNSQSASKE